MEKKVTMTFTDKEIEDLESLVCWGTSSDDHEDYLALEKRVTEAKESREVTMTFTEEELNDLIICIECSESVDNHSDYTALYERIKAEDEKLQEDEVKTAVYLYKEELEDLKRLVDLCIQGGHTHPAYRVLKDKLTEEVNNFPMNPVQEKSYDDVVDSMKQRFQLHFGEDKKADISLDSKIGKKCNIYPIHYDDGSGWVNDEDVNQVYRGVSGYNYVVEVSFTEQGRNKVIDARTKLRYFPICGVQLVFNIEDL